MKKIKLLILSILIFNFISSAQQIPNIKLENLEGTVFNTDAFNKEGKPIILAFWATWCIPCITELSAINDKQEDWKKEVGFELYAVSEDDSRTVKRVKPLINGKNWDFPVLLDKNQDLKRELNLMNVPYTIIIKNGKIIYRHPGYVIGDEDLLIKVIKENQ